jgi:hypothetical protein
VNLTELSPGDVWKHRISVTCIFPRKRRSLVANGIVDSGATGKAFMNTDFAHRHGLKRTRLDKHIDLNAFNGTRTVSARVTHVVKLAMQHEDHYENIVMYLTTLGKHDFILGQPWNWEHEVNVDYRSSKLLFGADACKAHRRPEQKPTTIERLPEAFSKSPLPDTISEPKSDPKPTWKPSSPKRWYDWQHELRAMTLPHDEPETDPETDLDPEDLLPSDDVLEICAIGAAPFMKLAQQPDTEIFSVTTADIEKALAEKTITDPKTKLNREYWDLLDLFSRQKADQLPEHRPYDHKIELTPGSQPTYGPLYAMSENELKVLRKYLTEHLAKGFIRPSSSPMSSPVIFVKKPGGGLRFCVDYRKLNEITIKNRYPIPLVQETLNCLSKAKFYTKLDIISAFNRIRIAKGHEHLTAFRTREGLFEYLVMPFGLANAPSTFQHYVNDVLRPFLDTFCTAYIDDILIYSDNLDDHRKHVRQVLDALQQAGLHLDIDKCEFHKTEVKYLGLMITTDGIEMDPEKVSAILRWKPPKNVKDVRGFIGFANFYRRFINEFSIIIAPLVRLTRKDVKFDWTDECQRAFDRLKLAFTSAPVLRHFDPTLPCVVEADSSDYCLGGVLSQEDADGVLQPVAYYSKRLAPAECNYEIYDKELLAIIRCFEQWRPELEGATFPVKVLSDHKNLQYFCTTKQLSHRQARWSEYLSRFDFKITYRPGSQGQKPDALTRRSQDQPAQEEARKFRQQTLLRPEIFDFPPSDTDTKPVIMERTPEGFNISSIYVAPIDSDRTVEQIINDEYPNDNFIRQVVEQLRQGARKSKLISLGECEILANRLYYRGRLVIPDHDELKIKLLRHVHDSPVGGHSGRTRTLDLLSRHYYWPKMYEHVRRFVAACHTCSRSKAWRTTYSGVLKPLPVPARRWKDISVDFVVELPESQGCTNIMVVVDRLTKMRHFTACPNITAPSIARQFLNDVWKLHGLPDTIVSDRGSTFVSTFWKELCKRLRIDSRLSTAFHPETDGQTERANGEMEQYLRTFVAYQQDDWVDWLPMAEFAANNSRSETTNTSPFLANYGQHPRMGFEPPSDPPVFGNRRPQTVAVNQFVSDMDELNEYLRDEMAWAQAVYAEKADRSRTPAPAYQVGDWVWLNLKNMKTRRPTKKLDWKNAGPYQISKVISPYAFKLDLPPEVRIHPVLNTSVLMPASETEPLSGQTSEPPPPIQINSEEEYAIEQILNARIYYRRLQFLVKWRGWDNPDDNTWESEDTVADTIALDDFEKHHATLLHSLYTQLGRTIS